MRPAVLTAVAVAAIAAPAALAVVPKPIGPPVVLDENRSVAIGVSPAAPSTPAAVTVALRAPLVCGRPRAGLVTIAFPAGEHVPASIARADVQVPKGRVSSVKVSGQTVSVLISALPVAKGTALCTAMTLGKVSISFARGAGLGNPAAAGTYTVSVRRAGTTSTGTFTITA